MRNIVVHTHQVAKDQWEAKFSGWQRGDPIGEGETEASAVYSLYMQVDEIEAAQEEQWRAERGIDL